MPADALLTYGVLLLCAGAVGWEIGRQAGLKEAHQVNDDAPSCPYCSGDARPLGWLGMLEWFRCRSCGMDFHTDRRHDE